MTRQQNAVERLPVTSCRVWIPMLTPGLMGGRGGWCPLAAVVVYLLRRLYEDMDMTYSAWQVRALSAAPSVNLLLNVHRVTDRTGQPDMCNKNVASIHLISWLG